MLRSGLFDKMFPPVAEIEAISVVRICADRTTYQAYGGPPGSAGYWYSLKEELVFYEDQNNINNSFSTLHHEAFHQYIYYALGDVAPHTWFNEGNADYFAGAKFKQGRFRFAPFQWRLPVIKTMIARKSTYALERLISMTQAEYYSDSSRCYAQGWAFVYFLREETRNRRYKKILPTYFDTLKASLINVREGKPVGESAGMSRISLPHHLRGWGDLTSYMIDPRQEQEDEDGPKVKIKIEELSEKAKKRAAVKGALDYALERAFDGVDLEKLEKAFLKAM